MSNAPSVLCGTQSRRSIVCVERWQFQKPRSALQDRWETPRHPKPGRKHPSWVQALQNCHAWRYKHELFKYVYYYFLCVPLSHITLTFFPCFPLVRTFIFVLFIFLFLLFFSLSCFFLLLMSTCDGTGSSFRNAKPYVYAASAYGNDAPANP